MRKPDALLVLLALLLVRGHAGGGVKLSMRDLRALAVQVGFTGADVDVAAAVAMAESGGDPHADGDPTLGLSRGLWQINHRAHPNYDFLSLYDPLYNARAAFELYTARGHTFHDWSTFNDGTYKKYMPLGSTS